MFSLCLAPFYLGQQKHRNGELSYFYCDGLIFSYGFTGAVAPGKHVTLVPGRTSRSSQWSDLQPELASVSLSGEKRCETGKVVGGEPCASRLELTPDSQQPPCWGGCRGTASRS